MATYLVTYDLNNPGKNYDKLIEAIKAYGSWAKLTLSDWLIVASVGAARVRDDLKVHIDSGDRLAVVQVGGDWATQSVPKDVTDWMQQNV